MGQKVSKPCSRIGDWVVSPECNVRAAAATPPAHREQQAQLNMPSEISSQASKGTVGGALKKQQPRGQEDSKVPDFGLQKASGGSVSYDARRGSFEHAWQPAQEEIGWPVMSCCSHTFHTRLKREPWAGTSCFVKNNIGDRQPIFQANTQSRQNPS